MPPTRRDFVRTLGGTAVLAACGDNQVDRFAGFTMGVQAWTFRAFSLGEALDMTAALGFARIEVSSAIPSHVTFPAADSEIDALADAIADRGLECVTSHVEPLGTDDAANRAVFDFARRLGSRTIMLDAPAEARDSLERLIDEYDIRIGVHNHVGLRYTTIEDVRAAIDGRDPRFGTIVDTGHYTRLGIDPVEALHTFAGRVVGVHLKDVAAADPAAPDAILGQGVVDVVAVFRALRDIGFPRDATLSLEYESNPDAPYDDVAAALAYAEQAARASRQ